MKYYLAHNLSYKEYGETRVYYTLKDDDGKFCEVKESGIIIMDFISSHDFVYLNDILQFLQNSMVDIQDSLEEDIKIFLDSMVKEGIIKETI